MRILIVAFVIITSLAVATSPFKEGQDLTPFVTAARTSLPNTADAECFNVPSTDTAECFVYVGSIENVKASLQIAQFTTEPFLEAKFNEWVLTDNASVQVYQTPDEIIKLQVIVIPVSEYGLYIVFRDISQ